MLLLFFAIIIVVFCCLEQLRDVALLSGIVYDLRYTGVDIFGRQLRHCAVFLNIALFRIA